MYKEQLDEINRAFMFYYFFNEANREALRASLIPPHRPLHAVIDEHAKDLLASALFCAGYTPISRGA